MKITELFEGENSSLRKTYEEATNTEPLYQGSGGHNYDEEYTELKVNMRKITISEDGWVSVEIPHKDKMPEVIGLGDIDVDVVIEDYRPNKGT